MLKASRNIEVNTSSEKMFRVICDFTAYPAFLPEVSKVEIIEDLTHTKIVAFELNIFSMEICYTLQITEEPFRRVSWTLLDSNWLKSVEGFWLVENITRGKCKATYSQAISLKGFVPRAISTRLSGFILPSLLKAFKLRAMSLL